jgi:hypothetical protein
MLPFGFGLVKGFCGSFFITAEVGIVVFGGDENGVIGIVFPVVCILGKSGNIAHKQKLKGNDK